MHPPQHSPSAFLCIFMTFNYLFENTWTKLLLSSQNINLVTHKILILSLSSQKIKLVQPSSVGRLTFYESFMLGSLVVKQKYTHNALHGQKHIRKNNNVIDFFVLLTTKFPDFSRLSRSSLTKIKFPWLFQVFQLPGNPVMVFLALDALLMGGMFLWVGFLSLFARYSLLPTLMPFSNFAAIQCFLFTSSATYGS